MPGPSMLPGPGCWFPVWPSPRAWPSPVVVLLVVETGRRQVTAIDLLTGDQSPVIVGLDDSGRLREGFFPFGIVSGAFGERSIDVSDDDVNKVYEFRGRP